MSGRAVPIEAAKAAAAARHAKKLAAMEHQRARELHQIGYANRFVRANLDRLRYCPAADKWLVWKECRWAWDETCAARRSAIKVVTTLANEALDADSPAAKEAILEAADAAQNSSTVNAIVALASANAQLVVKPEDIDPPTDLLNTPTGTVDLKTGRVRGHEKSDMITRLTGVHYETTAEAQRWRQFVIEVMDGDLEMASWLQTAIGYSLTGSQEEQVWFLAHGTGANGKSVFIETLMWALGDYAHAADVETFLHQPGARGVPNDVAALAPARFIAVPEIPAGRRLSEGQMKRWTGGDTITARFLFKEFFDFRPAGKLWLTANEPPRVSERSHGFWRRVRLVPFNVRFQGEDDDPKLAKKLRAEGPGILRWAVEGASYWHQNRLGMPVKVAAATIAYEESQDPIAGWLEDATIRDNGQTGGGTLFKSYEAWCDRTGNEPVHKAVFGRSLASHGFEQVRTKQARAWRGISLKGDESREGES